MAVLVVSIKSKSKKNNLVVSKKKIWWFQKNSIKSCTESDDLTNVDEICLFDTNDRYVTSSKAHTNLLNDINNSSDNNFTAISLNIRSLNNYKNLAKLEGLLSSLAFKPSLIAVTETWLKPNQSGPHTNLQDYIFISNL